LTFKQYLSRESVLGDSFRLLSACFYPPERETLLGERLLGNLSERLKIVCPDAAVFSARMEEAVRTCSGTELSVEYAKLFVGPYRLKAPPYGSVYLDDGRRVMGDSTLEVINIYQVTGLTMDDEFKELPDHIAAELEFMYFLSYRKVDALERSELQTASDLKQTAEYFLNEHLRKWVPRFSRNIKEGTRSEFYDALADCLSKFISCDYSGSSLQEAESQDI
jgi:TorA maturation chaperone TorD